jgi:hypothetical protein
MGVCNLPYASLDTYEKKSLKETVSWDFFIDQPHVGPWLTGYNRFAYGFARFVKISASKKVAKIGFSSVNDTAEAENEVLNSPTFLLRVNIWCMGIFAYETVLMDSPVRKRSIYNELKF